MFHFRIKSLGLDSGTEETEASSYLEAQGT